MPIPRPQFRLRSLFILTAIVAVGCLVGPPIVREVRARWFPPGPLSGDLAAMTVGMLPPLPIEDDITSWFVEGPVGPVEDQKDDAPVQAEPPTE